MIKNDNKYMVLVLEISKTRQIVHNLEIYYYLATNVNRYSH
jgi:hypothetical protein